MNPEDPPDDWPPALETKRARVPPPERPHPERWPRWEPDRLGGEGAAPDEPRPGGLLGDRGGGRDGRRHGAAEHEPRLDDATRAQVRAADPDASAWVSANAGSGKTRVLTDRVARLLLRGVSPGRVLCLTYTKAAASEMQLRLFRRLGAWSMLSDAELRRADAPPRRRHRPTGRSISRTRAASSPRRSRRRAGSRSRRSTPFARRSCAASPSRPA